MIFKFRKGNPLIKIEYNYNYNSERSFEDTIVLLLHMDKTDYRKIMINNFKGFIFNIDNNDSEIRFMFYKDAEKALEWVESGLLIRKL